MFLLIESIQICSFTALESIKEYFPNNKFELSDFKKKSFPSLFWVSTTEQEESKNVVKMITILFMLKKKLIFDPIDIIIF